MTASSDSTGAAGGAAHPTTDEGLVSPAKWRIVGPGLMVAATGVGAADLVATLVAGSRYGYALLWCAVLGCVMKIVLVEGAGRWTLATGRTIFEGWQSLGRWTTWYFGPYIVIWGFVYGAAAMAGTGLALAALFGGRVAWWGIASSLLGLALVWTARYGLFEKVMAGLVALMFVTMVGAAVLTTPNLPEMAAGLVPRLPDGSVIYVLSLAGGVGGTITLAAYGYWLREKGWATPAFMRVMRLDNAMAYVITGIFVIATLVVGAELFFSANIAVSTGDQGLLDVADVLRDRYGQTYGTLFLVGFWAAAMSSLLGVWHGVSLMFADFVAQSRGLGGDHPDARAGGRYYRGYLLWLSLPPIAIIFWGQPVWLILAYGVLGALFMPFMAVTLLWLLNTTRVPDQWRNRLHTNLALLVIAGAFVWLAATELQKAVSNVL